MESDPGQMFSVRRGGECFDLRWLHAQHERHPADLVVAHEHAHAVYHLVLYTGGRNEFFLRGRRHEAVPGVLALASPGEPHEFRPARPGGCAYLEATFELRSERGAFTAPWGQLLEAWFGQSFPALETPVRPAPTLRHQVAAALESLAGTLARPDADAPFVRARALLDLAWLLPRACGQTPGAEPAERRLERVARYLDAHYMRRAAVPELARMAGLSPSRFARAFTAAFGRAPIDYLIERRLDEAERLLRATRLSLREVALQVGFSDEFYFSRQFKKRRGRPPGACRRTEG